ncbi:MAG: META domain-containing protein [Caldilineaceae bacterium]|nr:META domain-containing protein [Caldilineaceae bacterium]
MRIVRIMQQGETIMFKSYFVVPILMLVLWLVGACIAPSPTPSAQTPEAATPSSSIQGIVWQWLSLTEKSTGNTTPVPDPQLYTIVFNADGTFNGQADCNAISGAYSQENGFSITLGPSTMAFCGEASLDQLYVTTLGNIAAGGPDGAGGLALETAGGEERMEFENGGSAP